MLERLVEFFAAQYRWGVHPLKLVAALLAPAVTVYLADRRVRRRAGIAAAEEPTRPLPRTHPR